MDCEQDGVPYFGLDGGVAEFNSNNQERGAAGTISNTNTPTGVQDRGAAGHQAGMKRVSSFSQGFKSEELRVIAQTPTGSRRNSRVPKKLVELESEAYERLQFRVGSSRSL